jgi:hypothetical protein
VKIELVWTLFDQGINNSPKNLVILIPSEFRGSFVSEIENNKLAITW